MRILVTGAGGFVGKHLIPELRYHGHEVLGIDRDDADLAVPGEHKSWLYWDVDYVAHLGARYGRILCAEEPHRSVCENAAGTTEIAAACAQRGIPVLYTSSSEVYGDHGLGTITEESELRMPTTIYGLSKRWGEEALRLYLPREMLCTVRMNMLYGPHQLAGHGRCALATFIANALEDKPYTVHRDATRSWLYISDAVRALRLLIEGRHCGTFNLGNEDEKTNMTSLAKMVGGRYDLADAPPSQIRHKNYSTAKLRAAIKWQPEVGLSEGIKRTVEAARKEIQVGV